MDIISQNDSSLTYTLPSDAEQISNKETSPIGTITEPCNNTGTSGVSQLVELSEICLSETYTFQSEKQNMDM